MNKADTTLLINKELTRIGIPLEHEHARYFRDGYLFAIKQSLLIDSVVVSKAKLCDCNNTVDSNYDPCCSYSCWRKKFD